LADRPDYLSDRGRLLDDRPRKDLETLKARCRVQLYTTLDTASRSTCPIHFLADFFNRACTRQHDEFCMLIEVLQEELPKIKDGLMLIRKDTP
jgi:hypothetical protein